MGATVVSSGLRATVGGMFLRVLTDVVLLLALSPPKMGSLT